MIPVQYPIQNNYYPHQAKLDARWIVRDSLVWMRSFDIVVDTAEGNMDFMYPEVESQH